MNNLIKTPDEYIQYYFDKLKDELQLYDLEANYFGFIGFIMNMMGWSRFDSTQYYEHLFKEGFVATSELDENLSLHGSIYGYYPVLSIPSKAYGNIQFDFNSLPRFNPDTMSKREVHFGSIDDPVYFDIDSFRFYVNTKYIFYQDDSTFKTVLYTDDGTIEHIYSTTPEIQVPLKNTRQYSLIEYNYEVPHYSFGSYHHKQFDLKHPQLSDIKVFVQEAELDEEIEYDYGFVKFLESGDAKTVFITRPSPNKFTLEFGSGIHGKWIPNANVRIKAFQTNGSKGNLSHSSDYTPRVTKRIQVQTYYKNGEVHTHTTSPNHFKINFDYSEGGQDMKSGLELRQDIVRYIQSRENLIDKRDFDNLYKRHYETKDFKFAFRKIGPVDNTFYLFNAFRDRFKNIIKSTNNTIAMIPYNDISVSDLQATPVYRENGRLTPGLYTYKVAIADDFSRSNLQTIECEITDQDTNAIELNWVNETEYDTTYKIYGRDNIQYYYSWKTESNNFVDTGNLDVDIPGLTSEIIDNTESQLSSGTYTYYIIGVLENSYTNMIGIGQFDITANQSIKLSWDKPDTDVLFYRLIRNDGDVTRFWDVFATRFLDDGTNNDYRIVTRDGQNRLIYDDGERYDVIYHPHFDDNTISPFIYAYNSFLDRYDGFFKYENLILNFREIEVFDDKYIPPEIHLNLRYDHHTGSTLIYLKSYNDISDHQFKISIDKYNIDQREMQYTDDNTFVFTIRRDLHSPMDIRIIEVIDDEIKFEARSNVITYIVDISDNLSLFQYTDGTHNYICNIPSIDYDRYKTDPNLYLEKMYNTLIDNDVPGRRMATYNIQSRFLETVQSEKYYTERILKQQYNQDIILPLHMNIDLYIDMNIVHRDKIQISDKRNQFLMKVCRYLEKEATGINIQFYNSQIIDLIHTDNDYIKSVDVSVYDDNDNKLNDGLEIEDDDTIYRNILSTTDYWSNTVTPPEAKLKLINFNPIFWYWDYNKVTINMRY